MRDVLSFPSGVLSGRPFTNPDQAIRWLAAAHESELFDRIPMYGLHEWADPQLHDPIPLAFPVPLVDDLDGLDVALEWKQPGYVHAAPLVAQRLILRLSGTLTTVPGIPAVLDRPRPVEAVLWWRQLRGLEDVHRRHLPSAKSRSAAAVQLGRIEAVALVAADTLTDALNAWVTTTWVDATIADLEDVDVEPNPIPRKKTLSPVGTIRTTLT